MINIKGIKKLAIGIFYLLWLFPSTNCFAGAISQTNILAEVNVDTSGNFVVTKKPAGRVECVSPENPMGWNVYDNTMCHDNTGGGASVGTTSGYEFFLIDNIPREWIFTDITGKMIDINHTSGRGRVVVFYTNYNNIRTISVSKNIKFEANLNILGDYVGKLKSSEPDGFYQKIFYLSFGLSDVYGSTNIVPGVGGNIIVKYYVKNGSVTPDPPKASCTVTSFPQTTSFGQVSPGAGVITKTANATVTCTGTVNAQASWDYGDCRSAGRMSITCTLPNNMNTGMTPSLNGTEITNNEISFHEGSNQISFFQNILVPAQATPGYFSKSFVFRILFD
ncbi:TPA: hypothetical protein ACXZU9_003578 [Salmonella enterica]